MSQTDFWNYHSDALMEAYGSEPSQHAQTDSLIPLAGDWPGRILETDTWNFMEQQNLDQLSSDGFPTRSDPYFCELMLLPNTYKYPEPELLREPYDFDAFPPPNTHNPEQEPLLAESVENWDWYPYPQSTCIAKGHGFGEYLSSSQSLAIAVDGSFPDSVEYDRFSIAGDETLNNLSMENVIASPIEESEPSVQGWISVRTSFNQDVPNHNVTSQTNDPDDSNEPTAADPDDSDDPDESDDSDDSHDSDQEYSISAPEFAEIIMRTISEIRDRGSLLGSSDYCF